MSTDTWIVRTRQGWKLPAALLILPIVGVAIALSAAFGTLGGNEEQQVALMVGSLGIAVAGVAWALLTVRCRPCGARLLLVAMRGQHSREWLSWLLRLVACPVCGDDGTERETQEGRG